MNTHDFTSMAVLKDYLTSASTRVGGAGKEALEEAMQHLEVAKRLAARSPSEYAELKAHGPVPLNSNRFAGLIISPSRTLQREWEQFAGAIEVPENVKSIRRLLEQADSRGLDRQLLHPDEVDESTLFTLADAMQKAAGPVKERSFKEQKFFPGWRPPHPAAGKKAPLKEAPLPVLAPAPEVPSEATLKWFPETGKMTPEQFKAWFATEKGAEKAATPKKSPWPFPDSSL